MKAKKSLGQHFLNSSAIAKTIALSAHLSNEDTVVEIGPGKGILTKELLACAGEVIAVEKDSRMIAHLAEQFSSEISEGKLQLIEHDALLFDYTSVNKSYSIVANIPYYITGQFLRRTLSSKNQPRVMVLLVQKEVAERIAKNIKGSILSMSVRGYATPTYIKTVKSPHFSPPPAVDSAILGLYEISRKNFISKLHEQCFFSLLKHGFGQKRKKLIGNLSTLESIAHKKDLLILFSLCNIPEESRAEDLTVDQWLSLSERLIHA